MSTTIPMLDLMFFLTETQDSPRHVGSVLTFEPPKARAGKVVGEIVDAYLAAKPRAPFNRVPVFPKVGLPRWEEVDRIDMRDHVVHLALPAPGTNEQLHRLVAELHAPMLDRHRPGWKVYVIEGLEGGRFAMYHKVHHALVDGESGMAILRSSLSDSARDRRIRTTFSGRMSTRPRPVPQGFGDLVEREARRFVRRGLSVGRGSVRLLEDTIEGLRGFSSHEKRAFTAPVTPMNDPIYNSRAITHIVMPLAEMKAVARLHGTTLNDVALCVLDAALERYLAGLGRQPDHPLVALCPVSLHETVAKETTTLVSAIWPPLGPVAAPIDERLAVIAANTRAAKDQLAGLGKDAAYAYAVMAFAMSETLVVARPDILGLRPANVLISNVRGPEETLYLNGARLEALFPVSTLIIGIGLNVTFMSYDGQVIMGFTANGAALPDLEDLGRYAWDALRKLQAAPPAAATKKRGPRRRGPPRATAKAARKGKRARSARRG
jgi:WS/DGAT/MGAT family acyltransferase